MPALDCFAVQVGHHPKFDLTKIGQAFNGVKWVLMQDWDNASYADKVRAAGLKAWGIVARESVGGLSYEEAAKLYSPLNLDYITVGNESDGNPDVNYESWCMPPTDCAALLDAFAHNWPPNSITNLCAIGTVAGDGAYVKNPVIADALPSYDFLDNHAYAQWPNTVGDMLDNYHTAGLPQVVGEFGWDSPNDPAGRGKYVRDMVRTFESLGIAAASVYCWDKSQGGQFYVNDPKALPFIKELGYRAAQSVDPPHFVLGFKEAHDANPALVGDPLENEWGAVEGISQQFTTTGLLTWARDPGIITFYRLADRSRWYFTAGVWKRA